MGICQKHTYPFVLLHSAQEVHFSHEYFPTIPRDAVHLLLHIAQDKEQQDQTASGDRKL